MDDMLLELNDEHSVFLAPADAAEEDQTRSGELDYVSIGVYTASVPPPDGNSGNGGYAVVLLVLPDSPAARAGLGPPRSHPGGGRPASLLRRERRRLPGSPFRPRG